MKKYWTLLPVSIFGLLIIYLLYFTGCGGIVEIYYSLFLAVFGLGFLIFFYLIQLIDSIRFRSIVFDPKPLLSLIVVVMLGLFVHKLKSINESTVQIAAFKEYEHTNRADLNFFDDGEIEVVYGHIEEKCSYFGNYILNGDTMIISKLDLKGRLELPEKLLINDIWLIPIISGQLEKDSTRFFLIEE